MAYTKIFQGINTNGMHKKKNVVFAFVYVAYFILVSVD